MIERQVPEKDEFLVVYSYKGHQNSIVIKATSTVEKELYRRKIKGVIEEIYEPHTWHYDLETDAPTPII